MYTMKLTCKQFFSKGGHIFETSPTIQVHTGIRIPEKRLRFTFCGIKTNIFLHNHFISKWNVSQNLFYIESCSRLVTNCQFKGTGHLVKSQNASSSHHWLVAVLHLAVHSLGNLAGKIQHWSCEKVDILCHNFHINPRVLKVKAGQVMRCAPFHHN